jgi:hypothetical protein
MDESSRQCRLSAKRTTSSWFPAAGAGGAVAKMESPVQNWQTQFNADSSKIQRLL